MSRRTATGSSGTSPLSPHDKVGPSLWYKTQRLTVALTDANGLPMPIQVVSRQAERHRELGGTTLYDPDRRRGRGRGRDPWPSLLPRDQQRRSPWKASP